jgi:uncharacterized protein with ParB-like and HNH nuclease domain
VSRNIEEKSIKSLIEQTTFIVPEIQREYVWGNKKELLVRFIEDIKHAKTENKTKNIGFLYSYLPDYDQAKLDTYLIDGQQRFTTLFLLLFYFALKEKRQKEFKTLFDFDANTGKIRFDYRVRNLTHDFIIDMINNVDTLDKLHNIKTSKWFLHIFQDDVSIKAILNAFKIFEDNLKNNQSLFDYLAENIKFWHFQTETTSQGEELYITMNSRGESIKDFENIKAQLFASSNDKMKYGNRWAIWEDFFWNLPNAHDNEHKETQNEKLKYDLYWDTFFEIILQCETESEKSLSNFNIEEKKQIDFSLLESYIFALFNADNFLKNYKEQFEIKRDDIITSFFQKPTEQKFRIPFIALMLFLKPLKQHIDDEISKNYIKDLSEEEQREIARVFQFFYNSVRRGRTKQNAVIRLMKEKKMSLASFSIEKQVQIFKLIDAQYDDTEKNKTVNAILSEHEIDKLKIVKESEPLRNKIETTFWQIQNKTSYILEGSLRVLFEAMKWQNNYAWDEAILNEFITYENIYSTLWSQENIKKELCNNTGINNSLLTRGLLTIDDYSIHYGGDNWSFGHDKAWNRILKEEKNRGVIAMFISKIPKYKCVDDYITTINKMIDDYVNDNTYNKKDWRYYFVKYPRMTQPDFGGKNVFTWWSEYNIEILHATTRHGSSKEPYTMTLHFEEPELRREWELCNGLKLLCANEPNTWIIRVQKNIKVDFSSLSKKYRDTNQINTDEMDYLDYFFNYDAKDDFIVEGIKLIKEVVKLKVEVVS